MCSARACEPAYNVRAFGAVRCAYTGYVVAVAVNGWRKLWASSLRVAAPRKVIVRSAVSASVPVPVRIFTWPVNARDLGKAPPCAPTPAPACNYDCGISATGVVLENSNVTQLASPRYLAVHSLPQEDCYDTDDASTREIYPILVSESTLCTVQPSWRRQQSCIAPGQGDTSISNGCAARHATGSSSNGRAP